VEKKIISFQQKVKKDKKIIKINHQEKKAKSLEKNANDKVTTYIPLVNTTKQGINKNNLNNNDKKSNSKGNSILYKWRKINAIKNKPNIYKL
jgi:hypothetical protein